MAREKDKVCQPVTIRRIISSLSLSLQSSLHAEIQRLRTSLLRLEEDKSNLDDAHSQLSRSTTQTINGQKSQLAELTRQAKPFEDESVTQKCIAKENDPQIHVLGEENDTLKSHKASAASTIVDPSAENDWKIMRDKLMGQVSYLRNMESDDAPISVAIVVACTWADLL